MPQPSSPRRRPSASRPELVQTKVVQEKPVRTKLVETKPVQTKLAPKKLAPQSPLQRELSTKRRGELAELAFILKAANLGFGVARPFGGEIHFFAAYIIPEDTWYLIPLRAAHGVTSLLFRRRRDPKPGLYDAYREAWHLLRPEP